MKTKRLILSALLILAAAAAAAAAGNRSPRTIGYDEARTLLSDGRAKALLVDVRTAEEYASGRIPGAILFPYDEIRTKSAAFRAAAGADLDRPIIVYCRSGRRSAIAADELAALGYRNILDLGAVGNWKGKLER
jgi:rhodanese-related sulfurtransferase